MSRTVEVDASIMRACEHDDGCMLMREEAPHFNSLSLSSRCLLCGWWLLPAAASRPSFASCVLRHLLQGVI
jgi:hypothetical protein